MKYPLLTLALGLICHSLFPAHAWASAPSENHSFRVRGVATYRCYGGYGAVKGVDSRTKAVCDNKTYQKTLVDEVINLEIKNEPTPNDSKDLEGSWLKGVMYIGRKFTIALSLFKHLNEPSKTPYRLRVVANDDEPTTRHTAAFADASQVANMNVLTLNYWSAGQPEEISYNVTIEPIK